MLKIRLRRMGARHQPFYRVVVADSRKVPTSAVVEEIGTYNPLLNPPEVKIRRERIDYWVGRGAQLSHAVKSLLGAAVTTSASAEGA